LAGICLWQATPALFYFAVQAWLTTPSNNGEMIMNTRIRGDTSNIIRTGLAMIGLSFPVVD
jgi:hypothetical protein